MNLFGFRITREGGESDLAQTEKIPSFAQPENKDSAAEITGSSMGMFYDLDGRVRSEGELVTRYREMSIYPETDHAIDDLVNEMVVQEDNEPPVTINLDKAKKLAPNIKKAIEEEFDFVLDLLDFNNSAYDIIRRWYIDGRLYYHVMIDVKNPKSGIRELRNIDPRKIRKMREPSKKRPKPIQKSEPAPPINEYFLYNQSGFSEGSGATGIKISPDSIVYAHSGLSDVRNKMIIGHLHKAIRPVNQLRMLEDSVVIYRLVRAPERRIFYIDVGNMSKPKAEQYLRDMMTKHKNKLVYDATTGDVKDSRKYMTMQEDYWLPRREGGKGTEISTVPAGQNLGEMSDVEYFRRKLYKALNVPTSRLESEGTFNIGRQSEITRDEIKFAKFVTRLRSRFSLLFDEIMERQLVLKGIMGTQDWRALSNSVYYDFRKDNHFSELKEQDIMNARLGVLVQLDAYVGKYYSIQWVRENVLKMTEEEIKDEDKRIKEEGSDQIYAAQLQQGAQGGDGPTGG